MIEVNGHKWVVDCHQTRRFRDVLVMYCTICGRTTGKSMRSTTLKEDLAKEVACTGKPASRT